MPPGNTTLPKFLLMPGEVLDVPPGKTTLPKLRCTAWPYTLLARTNTIDRTFMGHPLSELYRFHDENGRSVPRPSRHFKICLPDYFFFGAGAGGVAGRAAPGVAAGAAAPVPGFA